MKHCYKILLSLFLLLPAIATAHGIFIPGTSIEFIENRGQWDGPFKYKAATGMGDVFLEPDGFMYVIGLPSNQDQMEAYKHGLIKDRPMLKFHAYKMVFENANNVDITGSKEQKNYCNYYLGNNPDRWKTGIHPFLALDYPNIYHGIDLHVASESGNLKYDFIVNPGSNPDQIRLRFEGTDAMEIKDGNLIIKTSVGDVTEMKPYAYQYINGEKNEVPCRYKLNGNKVSYDFPKGYKSSVVVIIDPVVVFCTFTGSTADNWGFTATYDNQGNFYAGGLVSGAGYPTSIGAFQTTYGGGSTTTGSFYPCDMGIIKIDATGATKIYATYIGGSDNDQPHSMIVDNNNNLIIAGRTYSANYPHSLAGYDTIYNGAADIVITKLNATGTTLLASTFIGGTGDDGVNFNADEFAFGELKHNYGDDARSEVLLDNQQNVYLTAATRSTNFPTTANAIQSTLLGLQDAVVIKMNSNLSTLIWGTYLGGSSSDAGYVLALNNAQNAVYIAGGTSSSDMPSTGGTLWPTYQGGSSDGFVAKFQNSAPYTLQKISYIGRPDYDQCYGIQIDASDAVYLMGQTLGGTFPVSAGVYSNPGSSQFVMKMNPDLSTNLLSTVFGSGSSTQTNISPVAFLVDTCGNIYISGWGGTLSIPGIPVTVGNTFGMPLSVAPNVPAQSTTDGFDFYFIVLSQNAVNLLYATYYGRSSTDPGKGEHVDGGTSRFDKNGIVYQAICGGCAGNAAITASPFPTTPGSLSPNNGFPSNCNEVALKIAFNLGSLNAHAEANPDSSGCPPFTVQFVNTSTNGATYFWDFGDLTSSTLVTPPPHTYTNPGTYIVKLVVNNPNACNQTIDTTFLTIFVDTSVINSDFTYKVLDSCGPFRASFTNTSHVSHAAYTTYQWFFGDGSSFSGANPPIHNYPDTGTYTVTLIMTDTAACNSPDTAVKVINMHGLRVHAGFNAPDSLCLNEGAVLANSSGNATTIHWNFGDGQTSTVASPVYYFTTPGTYTITLIVTNPNSCNKADTATKVIKIKSLPTADFIHAPVIPVANEPIKFTNKSLNAVSYLWAFGDGTGSSVEHPSHLYKKTGSYLVCLTARSADGCTDTICKKVDAEVYPAIDVPTGFSPNGDGVNDIIYVRGAAIETVNFKIFNRWGQLVFETNDIDRGWDGTFNSKPQEMEVYAYTLFATFIDGSTASRSGNITLLR